MYYFISYQWCPDETDRSKFRVENTVTKLHPVDWLKEMVTQHPGSYRLLFFSEIEKKQHDSIRGWLD